MSITAAACALNDGNRIINLINYNSYKVIKVVVCIKKKKKTLPIASRLITESRLTISILQNYKNMPSVTANTVVQFDVLIDFTARDGQLYAPYWMDLNR